MDIKTAVFGGDLAKIKRLINNGANVNEEFNDYYPTALLNNGTNVIEELSIYRPTALHYAINSGNLTIVRFLIESGANINWVDEEGGSILYFAASKATPSLELVRFFTEKGLDINHQGGYYGNALQAASYRGNLEIVKFLVEKGADVNQQGGHYYGNALQAASYRGNLETVKFLVEKGADVNQEGGIYDTALQAASSIGNLEIVKFLVEKGADVNQEGGAWGTALHEASHIGNLEIAKLLIENGANVNQQDDIRRTALHKASEGKNNLEVVRLLVENGANVNQQDSSYGNALHIASASGNIETVQFLVENGADVSIQGSSKMTALHYAALNLSADLVEFLLGKGAPPNAKNDKDETPIDLAIEVRDRKSVRLLLPKTEPPPSLSTRSWRRALQLESAGPIIFTFKRYLSIEFLESIGPGGRNPGQFKLWRFFYLYFFRSLGNEDSEDEWRSEFLHWGSEDPIHVVFDNGIRERIALSLSFNYRCWRRSSEYWKKSRTEGSRLPDLNLCRQLRSRDFFVEVWYLLSCFTITDNSKWPSRRMETTEAYNYLKQVEGFFCIISKRPETGSIDNASIDKLLRLVFSISTCGETPIQEIGSIQDLIVPLIEKLGRTYEENCLQASRRLSDARLKVLEKRGRNEDLLDRLLTDATVIELMTEDHTHIVRSLMELIKNAGGLEDGPWRLSKQAQKESNKAVKRLEACERTLRTLLERSQNIIQLEFNLASILEARRSTSTNRSLKRLTWVTFVFLPLLFVASLFGMNVDILSNNPGWYWYFPVAGGFILLTFGVWILFKRYNTLEGNLERYFNWLLGDGTQMDALQPAESGVQIRSGEEPTESKKSLGTKGVVKRRRKWTESDMA
ncbi:ankyrin repeat-containing domain protein [Xylaria telfairii]|nr:ankyrin repeat-containing domain protein [Xylaria telfairii]